MRHSENTVSFTVSLPNFWLKKLDSERGDVPRSKVILRALEDKYGDKEDDNYSGPRITGTE